MAILDDIMQGRLPPNNAGNPAGGEDPPITGGLLPNVANAFGINPDRQQGFEQLLDTEGHVPLHQPMPTAIGGIRRQGKIASIMQRMHEEIQKLAQECRFIQGADVGSHDTPDHGLARATSPANLKASAAEGSKSDYTLGA